MKPKLKIFIAFIVTVILIVVFLEISGLNQTFILAKKKVDTELKK